MGIPLPVGSVGALTKRGWRFVLANGNPYVLPAQLTQYLPASVVSLATAGQQECGRY